MNPMSQGANVAGATLLETISSRMVSLRQSERKVAKLVLEDPVEAMRYNMAGLAEAAGVSEPTVMRFCSAIGFSGFRAFKLELAHTIALGMPMALTAIDEDDSLRVMTEKVFSRTISSLDRAYRHLNGEVLEQAIEMVASASELVFVGAGASAIVAQDAQQKFPLFGIPCQAPADYHQQFISASMSGPSTVFVAISNTAKTRTVLRVAALAKSKGAKVLAIVGDRGPITEVADLSIEVNTFEDTDLYTPTVSRLAGLVVIDVLATGVSFRRGPVAAERIREMKEELAQMRSVEPGDPGGEPG
ncbi:MAG: RpiR family transcriptional regulator [Micrococcales bacterium 73-13]|nr:MAG: RpiR family transcriptional regulator [Micrococcales bacterium 73-13]